jgi:hypothetical protein
VVQLDPHALRFTAPQRESGVADAHDEGVTPGPCLGEDLDLLTMNEAELEEPPLKCRQRRRARADADDTAPHPRRQGREAGVARQTMQAFWGSYCVHNTGSMNENGSHLQCGPVPIYLLQSAGFVP